MSYRLQDARKPLPTDFVGIMADPPYTQVHGEKYRVGASVMPSPGVLLRNCLNALPVGRRVAFLHFASPRPPKETRLVAVLHVWCGWEMQSRVCTIYERGAA